MADSRVESRNPVGYLTLLRTNHNYRSLWMGEVISLFGDWFDLIASAALIASLTSSGLAVGGLFVVRMLAPFLVSPLAGVVSDRYNRKYVLIASDLIRTVVVLGFLLVREPGDIWLLYTLNGLQLAFSGFFFPARNAILPDLVSRRELGAANALSSITWSVMLAIGSALGGMATGKWGIYPAFVIDSLTFLMSAVFIARIRYTPQAERVDDRIPGHAFRQYIDGLRYLKEHYDVLAVGLNKGALALVSNGIFQILQVIVAEQVFPLGDKGGTSLGLMYAAAGVGTGLGPVIARRFTRDQEVHTRWALALAYGISALGTLLILPLSSFPLALAGTFVRAFGAGINWVFSTQLLLQILPDRVRGRVFSTEFALFTLANAASTALGGVLIDHTRLGLGGLMGIMAVLTLLAGVLWAIWTWRVTKS